MSDQATELPNATLEHAAAYVEFGWALTPLSGKKPTLNDWPTKRLAADDLAQHFPVGSNVGVVLGAPSGELVDVDLDCAEAVELAPAFLAPTWTFGRASKPKSHWLYLAGCVKTERFMAPGGVVLELRGTGCQTMAPGSTHPSGELVAWTEDLDAMEAPTAISATALRARCAKLAGASLVLRVAGRAALDVWLRGGPCPELPTDVAELVRRWWGIARPPAAARRTHGGGDVVERARRYLSRVPGAVSGSGGHAATFLAAQHLVRGFELSDEKALQLLAEDYNPRCVPPWSESELVHKVKQARESGTAVALGAHLEGQT